ncbi:MAG: sulfurtransferase TusA family protein [Spirochaetaceae bacterium]
MATSFYTSPNTLLDEVSKFEQQIKDFRGGLLHPTEFKGIRVAFGVYEQRTEETFMIRIRCSAGGITPIQLLKAAELGEQYGNAHVHVTTRQEIQLHYVHLEDTPTVMRELNKVGLSTRGGGGNTVRNIMTSYNSGVSVNEVFDVEPYVVALSTRLISEPDSWNMPRKFKLTFSSSADDNANATLQDLGFIAKLQDGIEGFEVWTAGGMGIVPSIGKKLIDWIPGEDLYRVVKALKNMFHKHGDRVNKSKNRLRFLWKELTGEVYTSYFKEEYKKLENNPDTILKWEPRVNSVNLDGWAPSKLLETEKVKFELWKKRFVTTQKQEGLFSVKISLILGDLLTKDARKLVVILNALGDNVIRLSMDQNIYLRNIPEDYLSKVFITLKSLTNFYDKPKVYSNMIACTGADTCKLGICLPRGLTPKLHSRMDTIEQEVLDNISDLKIHISGCPNSCGQHHVGDLGFYGRIKNHKNRTFPAYQIIGGAIVSPGETRLGIEAGWVHSKDLPEVLKEILISYEEVKENYDTFAEYFDIEGADVIKEIAEKYNRLIPTFDEDKNYYFDWGSEEIFSTEGMGKGECSAGLFDMIGIDKKTIITLTNKLEETLTKDEKQSILKNIVYHTSRMLLVTRGVEAKTDIQVYDSFIKYFIEKGLISKTYLSLISAVRDDQNLREEEVISFSVALIELYGTMDKSMRFKGEESSLAIDSSIVIVNDSKQPNNIKDLRGVACPMNFVKTKMELSKLKHGDELEILLDSGAPINNVPGSVESEGHKILLKEQVEDYWRVSIKKVVI